MRKQQLAPAVGADRRKVRRTNVLWVASLSARGESVDCVIQDISEEGARVHLLGPLRYRRRVRLVIPRFLMYETGAIHCEPVWRADRTLGLSFIRD